MIRSGTFWRDGLCAVTGAATKIAVILVYLICQLKLSAALEQHMEKGDPPPIGTAAPSREGSQGVLRAKPNKVLKTNYFLA
jgi:hypothetical protein